MSELMNAGPGTLSVLDGLAMQARVFVENITQNMMQLGRVFCEAKPLVEHGKWGAWLEENSGMSERSAQKFMAAYTRYGNDERFNRLEKTKVFNLLALPEGTEGSFAEANDIESMSSREVEEAVRKVREEMGIETMKRISEARVEGIRTGKSAMKEFQEEQNRAHQEAMASMQNTYEERILFLQEQVEAQKKLRKQDYDQYLKRGEETEKRIAERYSGNAESEAILEETRKQLKESQEAVEALQESTQAALDGAAESRREAKNAQRDLEEAEAMLKESQEAYRKSQEELTALRRQMARGDAERDVPDQITGSTFMNAVRGFIAAAGQVPFMGSRFASMGVDEFSAFANGLSQVERWCADARKAIETIDGGGVIS